MKLNLLFICLVANVTICVVCLTPSDDSINTLNFQCNDTSDCNEESFTGYYCDETETIPVCKCHNALTYMEELNDYICLLSVNKYGGTCDYDEQCPTSVSYSCNSYSYNEFYCPNFLCTGPNGNCSSSACIDKICQCKPGFYYDGVQCTLAMIEYGGNCVYDEQCANSEYYYDERRCSEDGKCKCYKNSWYRTQYDECEAIWGPERYDRGPLSGLIIGCVVVLIALAGVIGYYAYRYNEKKKIKKNALLKSQSSLA